MLAFTGCTTKGQDVSNDVQNENGEHEGTNTTDNAASNGYDDYVTLQWFSDVGFWNPPQTWNTDPNTVQGVITQKTGVTFEMDIPPEDGEAKLSLMLVSGELPDVMTVTSEILIDKLVNSGNVWNLDELLETYDPDSHLFETFPEDIKQALILRDGGWYAYPSHMSSEDARAIYPPSDEYYSDAIKYRNGNAIMFNTNLMEEAGINIEDLTTEDDLLEAYKKIVDLGLTVDGAPVIPLLVDGKGYQEYTIHTLAEMFGGMPVDKDGNYVDIRLTPQYKHALKFLWKAVRNGFIDPEQFTMDTTATKATVLSGRVFSFIGNTANTGFSEQENWVSPGPILSNTGDKPVMGMYYRVGTGWMQTFISKNTKEPERLAKWLSFMSSDEGMRLHYYGFEGEDYVLNEKGLVETTEEGRKKAEDQSITGVFAYWPFHHISWHDYATQAPTDILTGADGIVAMQVQNARGKSEHTVIYDNSPLSLPSNYIDPSSELGEAQTQIDQYTEAQITKIIMAEDEETFDSLYEEMIQKMKELGIEEIDAKINEQVQKQYEEFGVSLKAIN